MRLPWTTPNQWEAGLSRLREALDNAELQRPDSSLVEQLAEGVNELRELASAAEAERSAAFSFSLLELMRQHATVFSDQPSLKPYADRVEHDPLAIEAPEDTAEALEEFDRNLRSIDEAVGRGRKKYKEALEADAAERSKLLAEINELHRAETDQYSKVESLFLQLFGGTDLGVAVETTQPPVIPASTAASDSDAGGDEPGDKAEVLAPSAHGAPNGGEATVPHFEITVGANTQPSASDQLENANSPSKRYLTQVKSSGHFMTMPNSPPSSSRSTGGLATS